MVLLLITWATSIVTCNAENIGQEQFTKQMLLYKLNLQIRQMDQELYIRCPGLFTHPDLSSMGIIGRRAVYGDAHLDLEIKLSTKTLDDLKAKYLQCLQNPDLFKLPTKPTTTTTASTTTTTTPTTTTPTTTTPVRGNDSAFTVLRAKNIIYQSYAFLALEVRVPRDGLSHSENWCRDYQILCASYGRRPTGCGERFINNGGYKNCATTYHSDMRIGNALGCNPSNNVANAANIAFGTPGNLVARRTENAFAFHSCSSSTCQKTIEKSDAALSYMQSSWKNNGTNTIMYTLCR